jgi:hypothetical protein
LGKTVSSDARNETFGEHRETLVIVNVTVEHDPVQSWTIPATTSLWRTFTELDGAASRAGSSVVLLSSSHTRKSLRLHAEVFRQVLASKSMRHSVVSDGLVRDSAAVWANWKPQSNTSAETRGNRTADFDLRGQSKFPGELVPPLGALVPKHDALLRKQTMYDIL